MTMQYVHVRLVTALFIKQTPCTGAHIQTLNYLLTPIGLRKALLLNEHHFNTHWSQVCSLMSSLAVYFEVQM